MGTIEKCVTLAGVEFYRAYTPLEQDVSVMTLWDGAYIEQWPWGLSQGGTILIYPFPENDVYYYVQENGVVGDYKTGSRAIEDMSYKLKKEVSLVEELPYCLERGEWFYEKHRATMHSMYRRDGTCNAV